MVFELTLILKIIVTVHVEGTKIWLPIKIDYIDMDIDLFPA